MTEVGTWERNPDGGYSSKVSVPGQPYAKAVAVWPLNKQRWMAGTVGIPRTVVGPYHNMTTAREAAVKLVEGEVAWLKTT